MKTQHRYACQLTKRNFDTLVSGGKIRLKSSQLGSGEHELILHSKRKLNKLHKACGSKKGIAYDLTPAEFEDTVKEGGSKFGRWWKKKASPWLRRAGHDLWNATKDVSRIAKHAAYTGIDTAAEVAPEVAPILAQGYVDSMNPVGSATKSFGSTLGSFTQQPYPQPSYYQSYQRYGGKLNPADNVQSHIDTGLYGVHNYTPDHILTGGSGNFLGHSHPASHPTLIFRDPLTRNEFGSVLSRGKVGHDHGNVHASVMPVYDHRKNIENTVEYGGSFIASGY